MGSPSVVWSAVADGVTTFLWIFCTATLGTAVSLVSSYSGVQSSLLANLSITAVLVFLLLHAFEALSLLLGGGSFNPAATAAFYLAGLHGPHDSLSSFALRFPAQAVGAVGGVMAIMEVMPERYRHMLKGPKLKVGLHTGAIAEGCLTFAITLAVLCIITRGPRNAVSKTSMLAVSTVAIIFAGSAYTGPSMNPVNAFGWAYLDNRHNTWEQFYVYWICPFIGSILAALVFRILFSPAMKGKEKKA